MSFPSGVRPAQRTAVYPPGTPPFKARLNEIGLEPVGNTPEEFAAFVRIEIARWAKVVKAANLTVD